MKHCIGCKNRAYNSAITEFVCMNYESGNYRRMCTEITVCDDYEENVDTITLPRKKKGLLRRLFETLKMPE